MTEKRFPRLPRNIVFALLVGCALAGVGPAAAAEGQKKHGTGAEVAPGDKELNAFVKAYVEYHKIRSSYGAALENAKDPKEKKRIEQEANSKVKRVLDTQGLTPERYNRILASLNNNDELRKKVLKQVEKERQKS